MFNLDLRGAHVQQSPRSPRRANAADDEVLALALPRDELAEANRGERVGEQDLTNAEGTRRGVIRRGGSRWRGTHDIIEGTCRGVIRRGGSCWGGTHEIIEGTRRGVIRRGGSRWGVRGEYRIGSLPAEWLGSRPRPAR